MNDIYLIENGVPYREFLQNDHRVRLDLSSQVLRLDLTEDDGSFESIDMSDRGSVDYENGFVAPLHSALSGFRHHSFVSASVLAFKAKQFDDGLYAAIELAAQNGAGEFGGKVRLLQSVATRLSETCTGDPTSILLAACELGGLAVVADEENMKGVKVKVQEFLSDSLRSKPLGFYNWSEELGRIFQQDRMLQTPIERINCVREVAKVLRANADDRLDYDQYIDFVSKLTNPLKGYDLRNFMKSLDAGVEIEMPDEEVRFFPPSQSHENELIRKLYGNRPIPDGFNLADTLIEYIRAGKVDLSPQDNSGWYDYQTWSLEPLMNPDKSPESRKLNLSEKYREQLVELFKGILALARETHVKQLAVEAVGAGPPEEKKLEISVWPHLTTEPLGEHYLRRALGYRFIRGVLEEMFGEAALDSMFCLTVDGSHDLPLGQELHDMEGLFHGAYRTVMREVGLVPDTSINVGSGRGAEQDAASFQKWASNPEKDPDLKRDGRMMVPVFYDVERQQTKVWAFLGWAARTLEVGFENIPGVDVFNKRGKRLKPKSYDLDTDNTTSYPIIYPVTAEVYVTELMNREEFQRHCDRFKTRADILANLK